MFKKTKGYAQGGKMKTKGMKAGGKMKTKGYRMGGRRNQQLRPRRIRRHRTGGDPAPRRHCEEDPDEEGRFRGGRPVYGNREMPPVATEEG